MIVAVILSIPACVGVLFMDRFDLHLAIDAIRVGPADIFFSYFTELGNGWVPVLLSIGLLWKSWRSFLMMSLSTAGSAILVQLLKHTVFADCDRPSMFLDRMPGLHVVPMMELHHYFSFPSGHTTAAFSMCLALAVIISRRGPAAALAVVATVLGFSRVYLSQHFTEDALAGALLGMLVGIAVFRLLYRSRSSSSDWLARSPFGRSKPKATPNGSIHLKCGGGDQVKRGNDL